MNTDEHSAPTVLQIQAKAMPMDQARSVICAFGASGGAATLGRGPLRSHVADVRRLRHDQGRADQPARRFLDRRLQAALNGEPFFKETHNDAPDKAQDPVATQLPVKRFRLAPGEVVCFRMLNGSSDNMMPMVVDGHAVHQIAMDGTNFTAVRTIAARAAGDASEQFLLASANRCDFLVKASATPGIYRIRRLAQDQQFLVSAEKIVAEIEVSGSAKNMALPDKLPVPARAYPLIEPSEIKQVRVIEFTGNTPGFINTVVGADYLINNAIYAEQEVPVVVNLDDAEEWHLVVGARHHGGNEGHPFHIHVNAFEVISVGGVLQPPGTIQDTVWVPTGKTVIVRMKFKQWTGKSVFHCHITPHEDVGMMQNFLILDPVQVSHKH
jgi:suppressor of ftsI